MKEAGNVCNLNFTHEQRHPYANKKIERKKKVYKFGFQDLEQALMQFIKGTSGFS